MSTRRSFSRFSGAVPKVVAARTHKFSIGETVNYKPAGRLASRLKAVPAEAHSFTVTRLLPMEGAHPQYRIKNAGNGEERVVVESEIQDGAC